jgi:two-component system, NarL family, nitrate/nitrite response regulator NarL
MAEHRTDVPDGSEGCRPASTTPIRVLIVDDLRLYREGLAHALGQRPQIAVVGTSSRRAAALTEIARLQPAVVLLDMAMPESFVMVRELRECAPDVKVVALAVADDDQDVLACAEVGLAGYVPRDGSFEDLVAAVESAARGELLCSPRMAAALFRRLATLADGREPTRGEQQLTTRELEILRLIGDRLSNKEIAARLSIEVATVKNHVHNILEKLHVHTRSEAAARLRGDRPDRGHLHVERGGVALGRAR